MSRFSHTAVIAAVVVAASTAPFLKLIVLWPVLVMAPASQADAGADHQEGGE